MFITESTGVRNLTNVKNVASSLPRYQIFTLITESILVTSLTYVKNMINAFPGSQIFVLITESILVTNFIHVKNVRNPLSHVHLLEGIRINFIMFLRISYSTLQYQFSRGHVSPQIPGLVLIFKAQPTLGKSLGGFTLAVHLEYSTIPCLL